MNEKGVGEGVRQAMDEYVLRREDIFVSTKLWNDNRGYDKAMKAFEVSLKKLGLEYLDFGFIHCIDESEDLRTVEKAGIIRYIEDLKAQGVVRHIGLSSHTPQLVNEVLDMGILDMLMFSINPAYDYNGGKEPDYSGGSYAVGNVAERMSLYRRCEAEGVGISVMKAFSGGQLLNDGTSPFGRALTKYQCIQYALDKPGVLTVLPGVRSMADLNRILGFCDAPLEEKDYSMIGSFTPQAAAGKCVYCNHCQPCPAGVDIPGVFRCYNVCHTDSFFTGMREYLMCTTWRAKRTNASLCRQCGKCEKHCPQHIAIRKELKNVSRALENPVYKAAAFLTKGMFRK